MGYKVTLRKSRETAGAIPVAQPYTYPVDLFLGTSGTSERWSTCVRTRPRWEKKFAAWMRGQDRPHFLPVFAHETLSGRKRRVSELPLFPGFVFVAGKCDKKEFSATGCVVYVLAPRGQAEAEQLHRELTGIWRGLTQGAYVAPVRNLAVGETCRIREGPLQGVEARFERLGRQGDRKSVV